MTQTMELGNTNPEDEEFYGDAGTYDSPVILEQAKISAEERFQRLRHHALVAGGVVVGALVTAAFATDRFRTRHV